MSYENVDSEQISALYKQVALLSMELNKVKESSGGSGEDYIAMLSGGVKTDHYHAPYDVDSPTRAGLLKYAGSHDVALGRRCTFEVKSSKVHRPRMGSELTNRWTVSNTLNSKGTKKNYDFLIILGMKCERNRMFWEEYPKDGSPYVIFMVPYLTLLKFAEQGKGEAINISCNPKHKSFKQFKEFLVSSSIFDR